MYIENPKTQGSGILCCIPQTGQCPVGCADCFFQAGRSYLEPLEKNLPNLPDPALVRNTGSIVRMNDGNDSNIQGDVVEAAALNYPDVFFNTSISKNLDMFPGPTVLTVNPGVNTDNKACLMSPIPINLMFVRFRANIWNQDLLAEVVEHYTTNNNIPVVVTFMAYYTQVVKAGFEWAYTERKRTLNTYYVITQDAWGAIMAPYKTNPLVYACGKDAYTFSCSRCGNCVREYHNTKVKMMAYVSH